MATTLDSISQGLQNLKNSIAQNGIQDASGNNLVAPGQYNANTGVFSASALMNKTTPVQAPPPPPPSVTPAQASSILAGNNTSTGEQAGMNDYQRNMLFLIQGQEAPQSQSDIYSNLYNQSGIDQKTQDVNNLKGQLAQINASAQAAQLSPAGKAGEQTMTFGENRNVEVQREAAIKSLPIAAALEAAQGSLDSAQKKLETLFSIQSKDAENQYNYRKDMRTSVMSLLSDAEKTRVQEQQRKEDKEFEAQKINNQNANNFAKTILPFQPELAAKISGIDWSSKDAGQQFSYLMSQAKQDPRVALDISLKQAELAYKQKQTALLGEPTAKEKKETEDAIKNAKASIPATRDKIIAIDGAINSGGLSARVGTNVYSRVPIGLGEKFQKTFTPVIGQGGAIKDIYIENSGQGQQFAGAVHRIVSGLTLDSLIEAKNRGATFGALSDSELNILSNSASAINDWEIKDKNGKGIGVWNIDEASMKKELENIKNLSNRALLLSQGTLFSDEEQSSFDLLFKNQDASNYYK